MPGHFMRILTLAAFTAAASNSVRADLLVNEVLANEPGASITLEWFELYNNGATSENLAFFNIQIGANLLVLPDTGGPLGVRSREYLVICRNLFTIGASPGFESVWGNNTGVWGDDSLLENYDVLQAGISLPNTAGSVSLSGFNSSQIVWTSSGGDGVSWERINAVSDSSAQSIDKAGATPGRVNSLTPVPFDLALDSVVASRENGTSLLSFTVINSGSSTISNASVFLYYGADPANPVDSFVTSIPLPVIDSGFTTVLSERLSISDIYLPMSAQLSDDDRNSNNRREFVVPGDGYPPAIVTEFLANPSGLFGSEWLELRNVQDSLIDLAGWQLGDAVGQSPITTTSFSLGPGEYLVLAEDRVRFLSDYPGFAGLLAEPLSWRKLNNNGDMVRLIDAFGIIADRFTYFVTHSNNVTWSRDESDTARAVWGRSTRSGGSPGEANRVRLIQTASGLSVVVSPQIISPDGDGFDDAATIIVSAPSAAGYTIRLYDRKGRVVRTLEDDAPDLASEYQWDGRSDDGRRLPVGIYILYVEAAGVESRKQTIVIGR